MFDKGEGFCDYSTSVNISTLFYLDFSIVGIYKKLSNNQHRINTILSRFECIEMSGSALYLLTPSRKYNVL